MPRRAGPAGRSDARDRLRFRSPSIPVVAVLAVLAMGLVIVGCSAFTPQTPRPTATTFAGIVSELALVGVGVENVVSGDPGCDDQRLARTAIAFDASGADQATPTRVYLYAFKDPGVYDELRPVVDLCARSFVADPESYATVDATPYVFAGPGPWAPDFEDALRDALERAAIGG